MSNKERQLRAMNDKIVYSIPLKNEKVIKIRQGAFGSGEHETTIACLKHLQKMDLKNKTVLDIGCGTGILGIASSILGASFCVGFDPSYSACETALFCNNLNKINNNHIVCGYNDSINGKFDIVVANIYQDILINLCQYINNSLKNSGITLLSGIPIEYNFDVKKCYENSGFKVLDLNIHDEYSTILLKKGG